MQARKKLTTPWTEVLAILGVAAAAIVGCQVATLPDEFNDEIARIRAIALAGDDDEPTLASAGDDDMPGTACGNQGVPSCKYLGSDVWKCYDVCGDMFYQVTDVGICVDGATLALYNCTGFAR